MNVSSSHGIRVIAKLATLLLLTVTLFLGAVPTSAQPSEKRGNDPHAVVSSDGHVPAPSTAGVITTATESYVPARRGSGAPFSGAALEASGPEVAPAAVPGGVGAESVIGTDNRYRITSTTTYPYRAIVHITSSIGGCSGWLIGPNTVATAGHCLHNGSWASNVRVYPGRNGSSTPYGFCSATRLYSVNGWVTSRNRNYDYGAIKLNCTIGNTTGWFGYRWTSASLTGQASYTAGYPGDKTYGTMWRSNDQIRISQTYRLYYANDTFGGQSGSPVWNGNAGCNPCGIAIHAYGVDSTGYNGGTRITQSVFNNLTSWKNA